MGPETEGHKRNFQPIAPQGYSGEAANNRNTPELTRNWLYVLEMHVRVDAARHDDAPRRVDCAPSGFRRQRPGSSDRRDRLARDADVAVLDAVWRHHVAAANEQIQHSASDPLRMSLARRQIVPLRRRPDPVRSP